MTDLRELAEIMDRLSKNPDDYHSQAASALRELDTMKVKVQELKAYAEKSEEYGIVTDMATLSHTQRIRKLMDLAENL